jgi:hypothetical protein
MCHELSAHGFIGRMLSVPTPAIDLVIDLAQMVSEQDYGAAVGRCGVLE